MISTTIAVLDANIFYGIRITSLVLHLAQSRMFRAHWTEKIHEEWIGNLHRKTGIATEKLERRRQAIDASILDCLITDYEALEKNLALPDPGDHHVVAAAVKIRASCIVTFNLSDFPHSLLGPLGLSAIHPDEFLADLFGLSEDLFVRAVRRDFHHYKAPPLTVERYIEDLRKAGVPRTAKLIEELRVLIEPD